MTLSSLSAYGTTYQTKVISALLTDKMFLQNISDDIISEYFDSSSNKWIVEEILKYFKKYKTFPTMEVLKVEIKKLDNEVLQIALKEQIKEAYTMSEESDLDYVKTEFSSFCKNQQLKKALLDSVPLLKSEDYDSIRHLIDKALKAGQDRNIGHDYTKDIESRYRDDERNPIPYPWKALNNITQGGYGSGELILIFGPPKGGKSWTIIDMAAHAAMMGFKVVYYTLELSETYVGRRIDAYVSGVDLEKLKFNRDKVEEAMGKIEGRIVIKELKAGRATLSDVEKHLRQLKNVEDFVPEVIFLDYLDLLRNRNKSRKEKIDDTDDIYVDARGLAKEFKVPFVSPSQINRTGANDAVIQQDKIAGAFSKFFHADFAMSLSRKLGDKAAGTGRYHIMGSRVGPDGLTFNATINTSNGMINIDENPLDDDEIDGLTPPPPKKNNYGALDNNEKNYLKKKFFEMENFEAQKDPNH